MGALSAEYRINPHTVQKAITVLKNEGVVETVPGIGNRVCQRSSGGVCYVFATAPLLSSVKVGPVGFEPTTKG